MASYRGWIIRTMPIIAQKLGLHRLIPISLTTAAHFVVSDHEILQASWLHHPGSAPCSTKRARTFGSFTASAIAA